LREQQQVPRADSAQSRRYLARIPRYAALVGKGRLYGRHADDCRHRQRQEARNDGQERHVSAPGGAAPRHCSPSKRGTFGPAPAFPPKAHTTPHAISSSVMSIVLTSVAYWISALLAALM